MKTTLNLILVLSLLFISNSALSYNTDSLLIKEEQEEYMKLFKKVEIREKNVLSKIESYENKVKTGKGNAFANMLKAIYFYSIDVDSSIVYFEKTRKVFKEIEDTRGLKTVSLNLATMYQVQGDFEKASNIYYSLLKEEEVISNAFAHASIINNLGNLFFTLENYDKALEYYTDSEKMFVELNDTNGIVIAKTKIASIYKHKNQFDIALKKYDEVLNMETHRNNDMGEATIFINISEIKRKQKKIIQALDILKKAHAIYSQEEVPCKMAYVNIELGRCYYAIENYQLAKMYNDKSFKQLSVCGYNYMIPDLLQDFILTEEALGNYKNAFNYQKQFLNYSDSIYGVEKIQIVEELETKYETEKKEKELLQKDLKIAESNTKILSEKRFQSILWIGIIALLLIASIILYFSFKQKRLNEKLEEHNDFKNKIFTIVSHDLRSPLAQIQREETTENVKKASSSALFILDDLLAWSKPNFKNLKIEKKKVIVNEVLEEVFEEVDFIAKEKEINIINNSNEDLVLIADANYLKIILRNCITNAIKYSDNGSEITLNSNEKNISILNTVGSTINSGTGLGLKISNDLAQQMDAKLQYANNNGTFTANLKF